MLPYVKLYIFCIGRKLQRPNLQGKLKASPAVSVYFIIWLVFYPSLRAPSIECASCKKYDSYLWHPAAPSEDEPPAAAEAPAQRKTKEAAPKKAPAAKKAAAPRAKAAGIHTLELNTQQVPTSQPGFKFATWKFSLKLLDLY